MEGDVQHDDGTTEYVEFQSTPSAWRETLFVQFRGQRGSISIHSLRMEGDIPQDRETTCGGHFNPLPPHGGRLAGVFQHVQFIVISIHSLRMEGDLVLFLPLYISNVFQSTPSAWRETVERDPYYELIELFQSTPSAWRETCR